MKTYVVESNISHPNFSVSNFIHVFHSVKEVNEFLKKKYNDYVYQSYEYVTKPDRLYARDLPLNKVVWSMSRQYSETSSCVSFWVYRTF